MYDDDDDYFLQTNYSIFNNPSSFSRKSKTFSQNQNMFLSNKRNRNEEKSSTSIFCDYSKMENFFDRGPVTRSQLLFFRQVSQNQSSNNYNLSSGPAHSQSEKRTMAAEKTTKKTKGKKSSKLKRPFKLEKGKERLEQEENIQNTNANRDNDNSRIKNTKTTLPNSTFITLIERNNEQRNPSNEKNKGVRKDNARDTVKSWFFKSVFNYVIKEFKKLKDILNKNEFPWIKKDFQRMLPLEYELRTEENFSSASKSSKKAKDIFYTNKKAESFYEKKTRKVKHYIHIKTFEKNNIINKEIINHIEDMHDKINEIKNHKIKDIILVLYNILNSNLNTMFAEYIHLDNNKKPVNFESMKVDLDNLGQEKSDDDLIVITEEAYKMAYD